MPGYFDIDAILRDEERVPVVFQSSVFLMNRSTAGISQPLSAEDKKKVTPSQASAASGRDNVLSGEQGDLPLWAALPMRQKGYVALKTPKMYRPDTFEEFKSSAIAPDIHAKSPHFYEVGLLCASRMPEPESSRIRKDLVQVYQKRYAKVIASAEKKGHDVAHARGHLSEREMRLLDGVLTHNAQRQRWLSSRKT